MSLTKQEEKLERVKKLLQENEIQVSENLLKIIESVAMFPNNAYVIAIKCKLPINIVKRILSDKKIFSYSSGCFFLTYEFSKAYVN